MKTEITRKELQKLLSDYGHRSNTTIPVKNEHGEIVWRTILNNSVVYNPFKQASLPSSNNIENATSAIVFIKNEVKIYSDVFTQANGHFKIIE